MPNLEPQPETRLASFHLATFPSRRVVSKLIAVPAERWEISQAHGCVFGKVLGTSKEGSTAGMKLTRWAVFAVWKDAASRHAFVSSSPMLQRWRSAANDMTEKFLTPIASKGSWGGFEPFPAIKAPDRKDSSDASVAVLTAATVRTRKLLRFQKAVPAPDVALTDHPGCTMALGLGEWPIGQLATFSIWESAAALKAYAYEDPRHTEVIRRTYSEDWYSEELFSRFSVHEAEVD